MPVVWCFFWAAQKFEAAKVEVIPVAKSEDKGISEAEKLKQRAER
jgi:hypothetical protein